MKTNTEKSKNISDSTTDLTIEKEKIEIVKKNKFLGSLVPNSSDDIKRRIAFNNSAFGRLKKCVWSRRDISLKLKLRLYSALISPIATYRSKMGSLTQLDTKKLNVCENNCLRAILNIRLQYHVSIDEIRKSAKQQNNIENIIRKRHLTWFGHICHLSDESFQKRMMKEDLN